jgi:hypothetical protein
MTKIKLVIDTNVWISYVINRFNSNLNKVLLDHRFDIISSKQLSQEVNETLHNIALSKFIQENTRTEFLKVFSLATLEINVISDVKICRDSKDDFLLSLAMDSEADYMITGDKDLLILPTFNKTTIVTLKEFIDIFNLNK